MTKQVRHPLVFVEWALSLLEDRFPWLGKEQDEPVSGADTIDELTTLHKNLIHWRDEDRPKSKAKPQ